jgi:hypothetical protein
VTLFTPWYKQLNHCSNILVAGVPIPLCQKPKLLGSNLDTIFTSGHHSSVNSAKGNQRYGLMKAVSGSTGAMTKRPSY